MGKLIITDYGTDGIEIDTTIPIPLTKSIADVMFPETRQGEWSKTITIDGDSQINAAFTHIYEINDIITSDTQYDPSFNPNKRASVIYQKDGVVQMRGFIRLLEINKILETSEIRYQCQIINNVSDFFADISGKSMADIDLTRYNHTITKELVRKSWDQFIVDGGVQVPFAKGKGYVHALINKRAYGGLVGSVDPTRGWDVGDTTPCLYGKELVDAIYSDAGQTYEAGGFFDSAEFLNWVVPYNGKSLGFTDSAIDTNRVQAQRTTSSMTTGVSASYAPNTTKYLGMVFQDDSVLPNQDLSGSYNNSTGTFTAPLDSNYYVLMDADMTFSTVGGWTDPSIVPCKVSLVVTNTVTGFINRLDADFDFPASSTTYTPGYAWSFPIDNVEIGATETLTFDIEVWCSKTTGNFAVYGTIAIGATLFLQPKELYYGSGSLVDFQEFYDRKLTQKTFMVDVIRTFNLWIDVNDKGEHIVKTRDDYLSTEVLDIEPYINTDLDVSYLPMGALDARKYSFTYKSDTDSLNELYEFRNNKAYGTKEYDVDNDFIKNTKDIKVSYSPTPMRYFAGTGMSLSDITFFDKQGNEDTQKKYNYRFLRYEGIENCNPYHIEDSSGVSLQTGYPLIGHIDDPLTPTLDGLFGMLEQHYLQPLLKYSNNTLWFQYYLKQYKEITDKNSKIVKAWLNIGEELYPQMSFDKVYYFDNAYFRLNKISDYKPRENTLCEFLKLVEYTKPASGSGSNGGWDDVDGFGDYYPTYSGVLNKNGNQGFTRGNNNTLTDTSIAVGSNNNYAGSGLVSVLSSNNVSISPNVTQATVLNSDGIEVTQDGVYIGGQLVGIKSNYQTSAELSTGSATFTDVTDLAHNCIASSIYKVEIDLMYQNSNAGDGVSIQFVQSGTGNLNGLVSIINYNNLGNLQSNNINSFGDVSQVATVGTIAKWYSITASLIYECTTDSEFKIQFAATSALGTVKIREGSIMTLEEL